MRVKKPRKKKCHQEYKKPSIQEILMRKYLWHMLRTRFKLSNRLIGRLFKCDKETVMDGISEMSQLSQEDRKEIGQLLVTNKKNHRTDALRLPSTLIRRYVEGYHTNAEEPLDKEQETSDERDTSYLENEENSQNED